MDTWLPLVNTALIGISGIVAATGYVFIRKKMVTQHRRCMITAVVFAALFLIVYLLRSALSDTKLFPGSGGARDVYLVILTSHTILATLIVPLVLITLYRALTKQFPRHRQIARITLPIWLYVVVTGWVIYIMLYQISWTSTAQAFR